MDGWTFGNQWYVSFSFQVNNSLNPLTQSIQFYTNIDIEIEDFIELNRVNYAYMASNQSKFVLPNLPIIVNLSKYKKALCFLCKSRKAPHGSFYEDEWFLYSCASTHFTLFESNFVDITLGNYGWVETTNLKVLLFMVTFNTFLIEHKIFYPKKGTTKVAVSKLWPVYYVPGMQMHFLSTRQIFQSGLRVEDNKSGSTFCDKSGDTVLLATPNLWSNI